MTLSAKRRREFLKKLAAFTAAVALCLSAPTYAVAAIAIPDDGDNQATAGSHSIAIGEKADASSTYATAIGDNTKAYSESIAIGYDAQAGTIYYQTQNVAIGNYAKINGREAIAIGYSAEATDYGTAVGYDTTATNGGTAIGYTASAEANGTAIGRSAKSGTRGVAIGLSAQSVNDAVAIGYNSVASSQSSTAIGPGANAQARMSTAIGSEAKALASGGTAIGYQAEVSTAATNGIAIGNNAKASGNNSIATGYYAQASNEYSIATGYYASAAGYSIANGFYATASGGSSIATGRLATASGRRSIASGQEAKAYAENSIATGYLATVSEEATNSVALGSGSSATADDSVALGSNSVADRANTVSVGSAGSERQITNVAEGTEDTDAVNVSQLKNAAWKITDDDGNSENISMNDTVKFANQDGNVGVSVASDGNGGAVVTVDLERNINVNSVSFGENGDEEDRPTISVAGDNNDELLITGNTTVDGTFTVSSDDGSTTFKQTSDGLYIGENILIGSDYVTVAQTVTISGSGIDMNNTKITGLAAGEISESSTDAINGSQIYSLGNTIAQVIGGEDWSFDGESFNGSFYLNGQEFTTISSALEYLAQGWDLVVDNSGSTSDSGATGGEDTGSSEESTSGDSGATGGGSDEESSSSGGSSFVKPGDTVAIKPGDNIEVEVEHDGNNHTINIDVSKNPAFESVTVGDTIITDGNISIGDIIINEDSGIDMAGNNITNVGNFEANDVTVNNELTVGDNVTINNDGINVGDVNISTDNITVGENTTINDGSISIGDITVNQDSGIDMAGNNITNVGNFKAETIESTTIESTTVNVSESLTVADVVTINNSGINTNAITIGNIYSDGNSINMGGGTITGLADGGIYSGSTDAVTGNQLWQAYQRMDDLQDRINVVGAHAAALSGLHPIQYDPYEPTTLSAAVGTYRDEYAVAVGMFHYVKESVMFNLGASLCSDGDLMGRAGLSFRVGRGGESKKPKPQDMRAMQAQLVKMQNENDGLKEEVAELKQQNEEQQRQNAELQKTFIEEITALKKELAELKIAQ